MNTIDEGVVSQIKHDVNIVIGRQIMLLRKAQGLTGQALAKKLGISQQQVSRYERGICKIDTDTLMILLMYFDASLELFFQKVALALKERAPKIYGYYHAIFQSERNSEDEQERYYLIKADSSEHYFR